MENTKQKVFSNMIWRFAERSGAQIVQFIVSIILARILAPEAYGTVALITVFTTILQVFVDSGLGNALIQKKNSDDLDFSTVFWTNIVFCTVLYTIVFLCAPLIARFYNNDSLTSLTRVLALTVLISGVKNVQQAYVSKHLMFKKFFFSTLIGTVIAAIVGILMALNGFELWALVAQQVTNLTIDTIILWITVKWRPKFIFSFERLKKLFSYGWKLLASSVIETVYNNIRQLFIGKIYSPQDLAYYNRAKQFPEVITNNINNAIDSVLLPTMSEAQDDKNKVKEMTRRAIKTSVYIMAPLMMGLAFTSETVIKLLLTDKWIQSVPYLCIFCITYMFFPIHTANLNAIKAMGRSDLYLKLELIKKAVGISLLIITVRINVMAMAYSLLVSSVLSQIINSWPNRKLLGYSYINQLIDILPSILLSVAMGTLVYVIKFIPLPLVLTLIIQIILGATIYIIGSKLLKIDSFEYIIETIKGFKKNRGGDSIE